VVLDLKARRSKQQRREKAPVQDPVFLSELHRAIIDRLEDDQRLLGEEPSVLRQYIGNLIEEYLQGRGYRVDMDAQQDLVGRVMNELTGFGPLQPLLEDESIADILINGPQRVLVERGGRLSLTGVRFINDAHVLRVVRRMLAPLGKRLDESSPMVDARLPDGSRVNAIIAPLALDGPCISIRKFSREALTAADLIRHGSVTEALMHQLQQDVVQRRNIMISGGTGTGKTTLLNVLSLSIPAGERVVTIEDSAELQLGSDHVVRLETRMANTEGEGEFTARHLVKNALRMRPDRIILGESRGEEVLDVLQAMNTGHMGSMSTVHANSAQDSLVRLQMMVRMSSFQGSDSLINQIIATALDCIVHLARDSDGQRYVEEVVEVLGISRGEVQVRTVYRHADRQEADTGVQTG